MKSITAKIHLLLALFILSPGIVAKGNVILQPVAVVTDMGESMYWPATNTINQSGLSPGYTSLVTDFDAYISAAPTTITWFGAAVWGSSSGVHSGHIDFDLGGNYSVSALALWLVGGDLSSVRQFNIVLDDNAAFSSPDYTGSFTTLNLPPDALAQSSVEVFTFPATAASFIRLDIFNTWDSASSYTVINEVAFSVVAVPEPSIAGFCGLGAMLLCYRRSRR